MSEKKPALNSVLPCACGSTPQLISYVDGYRCRKCGAEARAGKERYKKVATEFFRWWWNQPGTNTEEGFDQWWAENNVRNSDRQRDKTGGSDMKMAYIATNPETNDTYAITSADPRFAGDLAENLAEWSKDGAVIELLPADEAKARFCSCLSSVQQPALFLPC